VGGRTDLDRPRHPGHAEAGPEHEHRSRDGQQVAEMAADLQRAQSCGQDKDEQQPEPDLPAQRPPAALLVDGAWAVNRVAGRGLSARYPGRMAGWLRTR
jgi:hypothetical protein